MLFLEDDFQIKLLSVQRFSWKFNNIYVKPRPYDAISFRIKGSSIFSNGNENLYLHDGDILFMPENVGYHLTSAEEEIIVIHFALEGKKQNNFEVIYPKHIHNYENMFTSILNEWNNHSPGYYLKSMSMFYALLASLENHLPHTESSAYLKIKKSVEYINRNFNKPDIDIETLCKLSNMSDTYFRRLFSELYGTTPLKYINKHRIAYAVELIETGYYTVEAVSEKCGFQDPKYFSTVFKNIMGVPPSKYNRVL